MEEQTDQIDGIDDIDFKAWSEEEKKEYLDEIEECPIFHSNLDEVYIYK